MISLDDNIPTPDNPCPSLNDLDALKSLPAREQVPTPLSIVRRLHLCLRHRRYRFLTLS